MWLRLQECRVAVFNSLHLWNKPNTTTEYESMQQLSRIRFHFFAGKDGMCFLVISSVRWRHQMSNMLKSTILFFTAISKNSFSFMFIFLLHKRYWT